MTADKFLKLGNSNSQLFEWNSSIGKLSVNLSVNKCCPSLKDCGNFLNVFKSYRVLLFCYCLGIQKSEIVQLALFHFVTEVKLLYLRPPPPPWGGGGTPLIMAYTGRFRQKGVSFTGCRGYIKGERFHQIKYGEGLEKLSIVVWKGISKFSKHTAFRYVKGVPFSRKCC